MRDGWTLTTLDEVMTKRHDFTPVDSDTTYTILGVQRSGLGMVQRDPIRGDAQKFSKLLRVERDDVVYRTITAFEAPSAVVGPDEAGHFVTPQTFPVFRLDSRRLFPDYMRLLTTWPTFHEEMASRCTGTVLRRKTLSVGAWLRIPVLLPPLSEQRRIVDLIGAVDAAIAAAEEVTERAKTALGAAADRVFTTHRPEMTSLEDLASVRGALVGGPFGSSLTTKDYTDDGVPVIRGANMSADGPWVGGAFAYVSVDKADELHRNLARPGDVVFTQRGTLGQVSLVPADGPDHYVVSQSQMRLRVDTSRDDARFVYYVFSAPRMVSAIRSRNTATANPHINLGILRSLDIPRPALTVQREHVDRLELLDKVVDCARTEANRLRALRSNLLTVLLSGEHEMPETYDELLAG